MMMHNDDRIDNDKPPFSRLFVVCSKQTTKEDLLPLFEKHGEIEDMHMPKDRNTGASKGIAFVKYSKTSSAAAAILNLHMKPVGRDGKNIKVMISSNKNDVSQHIDEEKFKRLFIKVPRNITEDEITEHFSRFAEVSNVHLQKDKTSDQCRGFAYVNFNSFLDAAKALEQCDNKYKPIFATPRGELKRSLEENEYSYENNYHNGMTAWRDDGNEFRSYNKQNFDRREAISGMINTKPQNFDSLNVTCSPEVPQKCLEQLFSIIPGMISFRFSNEYKESKVFVKYETEVAAAYALESLNHYEFPSGELITIKPFDSPLVQAASNLSDIVNSFKNSNASPDMLQLAEAIAQASSLIKAVSKKEKSDNSNDFEYVHGVRLPFTKPLADKNSRFAKRCFLVLKPAPPPPHILHNIFCRFGDLIDVTVFPNKTFGFAKYASERAADEAIATLHGVILNGVKFKVMEADERPKDEKMNVDEDGANDHNVETKRAKIGQF